jgi:hypothetical protein
MGGIEGTAALIIGVAVVLFVPALVWATVIAGLYKIVRKRVRETRPSQIEPAREVQHLMSSK